MDHSKCSYSTGICGSDTAGQGKLDENGYWEFPCARCLRKLKRTLYPRQFEKFLQTLRICWCLMMARTFGNYNYNHGGPGQLYSARYTWRGRLYDIPMEAPMSKEPYTVRRWGLRSKNQLPLLMIWDEMWDRGEIVHAYVTFNSRDHIGF